MVLEVFLADFSAVVVVAAEVVSAAVALEAAAVVLAVADVEADLAAD